MDPSAPAAAYPPWILLGSCGDSDDPDARTVAHARTSKGRPISVSFFLAAPPAVSDLRLHSPGLPDGVTISSRAIAAHRDSVLINIVTRGDVFADDYFIYCGGDAAAEPSRPPSLYRLPPCYLTKQEEGEAKRTRYMDSDGAALLRRGQDEVLMAALDSCVKDRNKVSGPAVVLELCLLRSIDWEWKLKRLPVIFDEGKRGEVSCWWTDGVVPVGDRFLLWVDYFRGIIYSDVWHETPELRYLSLPVEASPFRLDNRNGSSYRCVCASDDGRAVKFVEVFPRCCCGCPGETACGVSHHAFTITTWELRMDGMTTWDKVGVVDCEELWSLPGYHGVVPQVKPKFPTMSLDDTDVLCFMVRKNIYDTDVDGDLGTWLIEMDTRHVELRSICHYDRPYYYHPNFLASGVSLYFDAFSRSRTLARRKDTNLDAPARPSKLTLPRVAPPELMLATLREIPNLARDDMLKAYGVLVWDESQFKFRSLLALPMHMRKDYCLLIGKLPCFDVYAGVGNLVC